MSDELIQIGAFKMTSLTNTSKVTFFGKHTNPRMIYKNYRTLFENANQVSLILDSIPNGSMLVINETNLNARLETIVSYLANAVI